ncbi:tripartite tricarboxylate transporter substrate binding protein [Clostridium sp. AM58-1XD]|uniref:Bug family tripartite tricarboxylate transporter substrate binding protein n=1 Tax=Clostridium sp. AM58-1XD TaxID=2292307 RepID=UPI000E4ABE89|nr:tripartite tricarboxylate transporter substrate binding protein [Clostridium sp. AM58-1XD]RGY97595.1 tripartite tricarboxylate transporter substrate binding protein [Clostridium sp. AM58-1XD]
MRKRGFEKAAAVVMAAAVIAVTAAGCGSGSAKEETTKTAETSAEKKDETKAENGAEQAKEAKESGDSQDLTPINDYPASSVTITCPPSAGGGTDLLLRAMAPAMEEYLGVPVSVVNKSGGGCAIGFAAGAQDPNDGSCITAGVSELLGLPYVSEVNFTYESFDSVCNFNSCYGALSVAADAPYNTLEEFVDYCKENPGKVRIGNSGIGGVWHILAASFADEAGIEVVHVPFDGGGPAAVALAGGNVEAVPVSPQEVQTYVDSGLIKVLATFSPERLPELPDVPTAGECGYPNSMMTVFRGFLAPKGTPEDIIKKLDAATRYALEDESVCEFMETQNYTHNYMNAADFKALMDREDGVYSEQSRALGIATK